MSIKISGSKCSSEVGRKDALDTLQPCHACRLDPIELEIFKSIFHSIAEEMGAALLRTAFSPNIKERRDYSCAVFDAAGQALAMGDHMPVHLGSMPMSVRAALHDLTLQPGDIAMVNDPFRGGTHLPDITFVAPVFIDSGKTPEFFRRLARASRRCRRHLCRIHGTVQRNLPGGIPHSSGEDCASRHDGPRSPGVTARQRSHATRTRRRSERADCGLPYRRSPPARGLQALWIAASEARRQWHCFTIPSR